MEIWPDVGPPFPGGWKDPLPRHIDQINSDDDPFGVTLISRANEWGRYHPILRPACSRRGLERLRIRRRFSIVEEGVLRVDTAVMADGSAPDEAMFQEPDGINERWLRTWARSTISGSYLVATVRSAAGETELCRRLPPYHSPNFEFVRSTDMSAEPAAYPEPWAAFVSTEGSVGLVFGGAVEVRFGGAWMPSVLYKVPHLSPDQPRHDLPPYLIVAGAGGAECVREAWRTIAPELDELGAAHPSVLAGR